MDVEHRGGTVAPANVGKREVQANCRRHLSICYCPELQNNRLSISTGLASAQSSSRKATHSSYTESQQADNADSQTRTVRETKRRWLNHQRRSPTPDWSSIWKRRPFVVSGAPAWRARPCPTQVTKHVTKHTFVVGGALLLATKRFDQKHETAGDAPAWSYNEGI